MANSGRSVRLDTIAPQAGVVAEMPIVNPDRITPPCFDVKFHDVFLRLPEALIPPTSSNTASQWKGKASFTVRDGSGRAVQVQMANRVVFAQRAAGGKPWDRSVHGTPQLPFSFASTIEEAWATFKEKLGGWDGAV